MTHIYDFLHDIWKSDELKKRILLNLIEHKEKRINIGVFSLQFDFKNCIVHIFCNDPDYRQYYKYPEIDLKFEMLKKFINKDFE